MKKKVWKISEIINHVILFIYNSKIAKKIFSYVDYDASMQLWWLHHIALAIVFN